MTLPNQGMKKDICAECGTKLKGRPKKGGGWYLFCPECNWTPVVAGAVAG